MCKEESFVLHIVAMYTLAYFKDKRAYPGIVAVAKLPSEIINPLLEDTITEGLSNVIASVYNGSLDPIKEIIESSECDKYVRRAAIGSLVALVVNGIIDRDEVVCYFKGLHIFTGLSTNSLFVEWGCIKGVATIDKKVRIYGT